MKLRLLLILIMLTSAEVLSMRNYVLHTTRTGRQSNYVLHITRTGRQSNHITLTCTHGFQHEANGTFWRTQREDLKDREPIAKGTKHQFALRPHEEAIYGCGDGGNDYSDGVELLRYPERTPGTTDLYLVPIGTSILVLDGGMEPAIRSKNNTTTTWYIGETFFITEKTQHPRMSISRENRSLILQNMQREDGNIYESFTELFFTTSQGAVTSISDSQYVAVVGYTLPVSRVATKKRSTGHTTIAVQPGEHKNATIICTMEMYANEKTVKSADISWALNGKELAHGEKNSMWTRIHNTCIPTEKQCHLTIEGTLVAHTLGSEDNGEYTCSVTLVATGAQDGTDHVKNLESKTSLHVLTSDVYLEVNRLVGGDYDVSLSNLPSHLPLNQTRLKIRLTDVQSHVHTDLLIPLGHILVVTPTKVTYQLKKNDIKGLFPSVRAWIQVALKVNGVPGPFVPHLSDATEITLEVTEVTEKSEDEGVDVNVIVFAVTTATGTPLIVIAVLLFILICRRISTQRHHCTEHGGTNKDNPDRPATRTREGPSDVCPVSLTLHETPPSREGERDTDEQP